MAEAQKAKRLQLIIYIKNNMQLAQTGTNNMSEHDLQKFVAGQGPRQDGTLHFDQSIFKKKMDKRKNRRNSLESDLSSVDSELSNDAFTHLVSENWGGEESELRQAIYFQFIKTTTNSRANTI